MRLRKLDGDELTNLDSVLAESYRSSIKTSDKSKSQFGNIGMAELEKIEVENDRLGSNPVLVTYQASQLINFNSSSIHGFVDRLRGDDSRTQDLDSPVPSLKLKTSALGSAPGSPFDDSCELDDVYSSMPLTARTSTALNKVLSFPAAAQKESAPLDTGDPYSIIRRLVKMVEMLQEERDVQHANPAHVDALQQEITELRIENANM